MRGALLVFLLVLLPLPATGEDDACRERLVRLEEEFAVRYMDLATRAKRYRYPDLTRTFYEVAESLDPGNDDVIDFDPEVARPAPKSQKRRRVRLELSFVELRAAEARARLDLARWCADEVLEEEAIAQAVAAFALVPGTVTFDADGAISAGDLGALPKSLSLSIFETHDVFGGSLVRLESIPETVPWRDGWRLATKHFDISTNVSGDLCRTLGRALEAAREIYREETDFEVRERITVWVVATRMEYHQLWEARERPRPAPSNLGKCVRDFCGVDGSKPTRTVVSTAIHEVAHGYLNLGLEKATGRKSVTMPPWYHEGLATYCAGYGKDSLSWRRGEVNPEFGRDAPLAAFRKMVESGEARDLVGFLGAEPGGTAYYLQACAFYWFFRETDDTELRVRYGLAVDAMRRARLRENRTERGREIFLREIGRSAADLERAFLAWARSTSASPEATTAQRSASR